MVTVSSLQYLVFAVASLVLVVGRTPNSNVSVLAFSSGSTRNYSYRSKQTRDIWYLRALSIEGEAAPGATIAPEKLLDNDNVINDDDDDVDELVDSITQKVEDMEGIWYSDDFYGPHGREYVTISARLIGETARNALVAVKVTGDPNVPAGCETFKTSSWPNSRGGEPVPAKIQVRADPQDPNGFSWIPGELTMIETDQLRLMCQYNVLMRNQGTFYKQNDEEGGDGGKSS